MALAKEELLKKEIEECRSLLNVDRMTVSFAEIMSMYECKELEIKPDYQRHFHWDENQRTSFIESVFLGIPMPAIYVIEDGSGV